MILLFFFLSLCLGLSVKVNLFIGIPLAIIYSIFIFFRHDKKVFTICLSLLVLGVGLSYIKFDIKREIVTGIVIETKDNYFILNDGLERYYISQYDNEYEIGDILRIKGKKEKLDFIRLEGEFDFEKYLNNKGVEFSLINTKIQPIISNPLKLFKLRKLFLSRFDDRSRSLIASILFSDHSFDSRALDLANSLHLTRLVSASGLYVYFFLSFIEFFLSYRLKEKHAKIFSLIILSPYLIFTFPRFSVIKICFVYLFRIINKFVLKKKLSNIGLLSLSGIFFLLIDYHLVYQDSFILGFSIPILLNFINEFNRFKKRIPKRIYGMISLFFFFVPFEVKFFNEIAPLSMIYQLVLSPLFFIYALLGMTSFIGVPIGGFINLYSLLIEIILILGYTLQRWVIITLLFIIYSIFYIIS